MDSPELKDDIDKFHLNREKVSLLTLDLIILNIYKAI